MKLIGCQCRSGRFGERNFLPLSRIEPQIFQPIVIYDIYAIRVYFKINLAKFRWAGVEGFIWLRNLSIGEVVWTQWRIFGLHEIRGILLSSWATARVSGRTLLNFLSLVSDDIIKERTGQVSAAESVLTFGRSWFVSRTGYRRFSLMPFAIMRRPTQTNSNDSHSVEMGPLSPISFILTFDAL